MAKRKVKKPNTGYANRVNVIKADSDTTLLNIGVMISAKWMLDGIAHGFFTLDFTAEAVADRFVELPIPRSHESMCAICEAVSTVGELCNAIEVGFEDRGWQAVIIDYIQIITHDDAIPDRLTEIAKKHGKPIICLSKISRQRP